MFSIRPAIVSLLAAAALGVAACGGDSDGEKIQRDAAEIQEDAEQLAEDATDTAGEAIDEVKDDANVPDEVEAALEQAQQGLEQSTP